MSGVPSRLRELLGKATPGRWVVEEVEDYDAGTWRWVETVTPDGKRHDLTIDPDSTALTAENAALIVAAVNALPALLDVAEAADKVPRSGHTDRVGLTAALARLHAQPEQTEEEES